MASKKVEELKAGDRIFVPVWRDAMAYVCWAKVSKIETIRAYNSAMPGKQLTMYKVFFKPETGSLRDEELYLNLEEDKKVSVPPKPGKLKRIWDALLS